MFYMHYTSIFINQFSCSFNPYIVLREHLQEIAVILFILVKQYLHKESWMYFITFIDSNLSWVFFGPRKLSKTLVERQIVSN